MASALAEAYVTVGMDSAKVPGQLGNIKSMVANAVGDMASTFAMTGFVFQRLIDAAKDFARAIATDEEEVIRFNNAVESSGRGQYFKNMVKDIGEASVEMTAFSADAVRAAATAIVPFKTLSNEMAGRVLVVSQDLAAQFGKEFPEVARTLARSLERPEIGMRQLRAAGVNLTAAQQQQIMTMLKLGQVAQAQELMLTIAAEKGAGAAAKMGGTLKGIWSRIQEEISEISEALGSKMMSSLKSSGEAAIGILKAIKELLEGDSIVGRLAQVAAGFLAFAIAGSVFERVFSTVKGLLVGTLGPLGWVVAAVVAVGLQFVSLRDILAWFKTTWDKIVSAVVDTGIWDRLKASVGMLGDAFLNMVSSIVGTDINWEGMFSGLGDWIAWGVSKLAEFSTAVVDFFIDFIENSEEYWQLFKLTAESAVLEVVGYFQDNFPKMTSEIVGVVAGIESIVTDAMNAIKAVIKFVIDTLETLKTKVQELIPGLKSILDLMPGKGMTADDALAFMIPGMAGPLGVAGAIVDAGDKARRESLAKGSKETRQQQIDLDSELADMDEARWERQMIREGEKAKYIADAKDKAETARWMKYLDDLEASESDDYEGEAGGKKLKEEKEKGMATGFVGVAEFAKQFQAAVLKSDADKYAKQTADNTDAMREDLEEINENTKDTGVFGGK